jgi:hypothetical protein
MASLAAPISIGEFGHQRTIPMSPVSPAADVLARLCLVAPDFQRAPTQRTVQIIVGGKPIDFPYSTGDRGLPNWAKPVFESLASNWGARPGWDSYGAAPTNANLVVRLLNILSAVMQNDSRPPQMTPLADGGMQAEWHGACDLEVVVPSNESPSYYFFDNISNHEEEDTLNLGRVRELIRKM